MQEERDQQHDEKYGKTRMRLEKGTGVGRRRIGRKRGKETKAAGRRKAGMERE
jgi:hypothetical protein